MVSSAEIPAAQPELPSSWKTQRVSLVLGVPLTAHSAAPRLHLPSYCFPCSGDQSHRDMPVLTSQCSRAHGSVQDLAFHTGSYSAVLFLLNKATHTAGGRASKMSLYSAER